MSFLNKSKTSSIVIKSPQELFIDALKLTSGVDYKRSIDFNIFYQIVAFKGITDGIGTSTIVANTALALAKLGLNVCVIDSSVLTPSQDILLKTTFKDKEKSKRLDWFDMMYTERSVLHQSKINKNISVLSFKGKGRDITDILSTQDSPLLVETALSVLHDKFDIILIDCCSEATQINASCLQLAQKVIQVWSDTPHIITNVDVAITNNVILSCPLDKMRFVILSKIVNDIHCNFSELFKQYRFTLLTSTPLSIDIARVNASGGTLWSYPSKSADIVTFNNSIIEIVSHLLNLQENVASHSVGTFTTDDIDNGLVNGTVTKKLKEKRDKINDVLSDPNELDSDNSNYSNSPSLDVALSNEDDTGGVQEYIKASSENEVFDSDDDFGVQRIAYAEETAQKRGIFRKRRSK